MGEDVGNNNFFAHEFILKLFYVSNQKHIKQNKTCSPQSGIKAIKHFGLGEQHYIIVLHLVGH